jgi:hypothetical protein
MEVIERTRLFEAAAALPGLTNFGVLKRENGIAWPLPSGDVSIRSGLLRDLLRLALEHVRIDERYYLLAYPDVGKAVEGGLFADPHHHYVEFGFFEDRLPFRVEVDEDFYFRTNPDVELSVMGGFIHSAQAHFERSGYKEGRLPREGWSLLSN